MSRNPQCFAAWALALAWAGLWSFFVVASELTQATNPMQKAIVCLMGVVFFLGSAAVPLRWKRMGAYLLLLEGILLSAANFAYLHNPPATQIFLLSTLAAPPLLSGLLMLTAHPQTVNG